MTSFDQHLEVAQAFLDLGLVREAQSELDKIAPEMRLVPRVLGQRVAIYENLGDWEQMRFLAAKLCKERPQHVQWYLSLAKATRNCRSIEAAVAVLTEAVKRFPAEPAIHFDLACYQTRLGRHGMARSWLVEAIRLGPKFRGLALEHPDLSELRAEIPFQADQP